MALVPTAQDALLYGVDLRLTDAGDLAVANGGDLVQAIGTINAAQAIVNRLRTAPGDLPLHPDFGSTLIARVVGSKIQDPQQVIAHVNTVSRQMAGADRRFLGMSNIQVDVDPAANTTSITCTIQLSGGERLQVGDLAAPRTDEIAMDPSDLADLTSLGDLSDTGLTDTAAGIDADDPDYGDVPDFSQLLGNADEDLVTDSEGP